jgi:divalent metal cation (Fe/Co/Zn/Cd) transporter
VLLMPTHPVPAQVAPARRSVLARRVRWLVAATITYNVIEAIVAITAGTIASSTALVGFGRAGADHSTAGLVLAAVGLAVMPTLSAAQRRTGRELGSASAVADSRQTLLCTYLSAVVLVGLGLNSLFGWSWADPTAALVIAAIAVKEGRDAWRGDACCAIPHPGAPHDHPAEGENACGCGPGCDCGPPPTADPHHAHSEHGQP